MKRSHINLISTTPGASITPVTKYFIDRPGDIMSKPIWGEPTKQEVEAAKRLEKNLEKNLDKQKQKVNFAENIRTARHNHQGYCSIEALYQAFKQRLIDELNVATPTEPNPGGCHPHHHQLVEKGGDAK